ncbi:MAG TPA: hypothetical protein VL947_05885 [Cytophagales bacterium]|nr:hypothetical protein [Cytophagales bacterium]
MRYKIDTLKKIIDFCNGDSKLMKEPKGSISTKTSITIFIVTVAVIAPLLNNYILSSLFFPGNSFHLFFVLLFTFVETTFLTFSIHLVMWAHGMKWFYNTFILRKTDADEQIPQHPKKFTLLLFPAIMLYGLTMGILVRFFIVGYSLMTCIGLMTVLSLFWGLLFRHCWNKNHLLWLYAWIYVEDQHQS